MGCRLRLEIIFRILIGFMVFLNLACSLDVRVSDLSSNGTTLNQNPSESLPTSTLPNDGSSPAIEVKLSGEPFFNYHANNIQVDSQGRKIYAGFFSSFTFNKENAISRLARLNSDGSIDSTFNVSAGYDSAIRKVLLTTDQEILAIGSYSKFNQVGVTKISRIKSNGELNTAYAPALYDNVYDMAFTPDGKIIAVGNFWYWNTSATPQESIVRINIDGTRDTSFTIGTSFSPIRSATDIAIQNDGKILIGGNFNSYNGNTSPKLIRLNASGAYDSSFITGTGFNGSVSDLEILSDGRILVVGNFTSYNGTNSVNRVALLNANGVIDNSFQVNIGAGFDTAPIVVKEIAGVGILIGGNFTTFQGVSAGGIVCLNTNGTVCSSVNFGVGVNTVAGETINDIQKLNSTTLLLAGSFASFNSIAGKNIVALNLDGSDSGEFSSFKGLNRGVESIQIQSDGKVIIGGDFLIYNPINIPQIVRFNTDQTLDEDFTANVTNISNIVSVSGIVVDENDKIWVSGSMVANGSYSASNLIRLNEDGTIDSSCGTALGIGFNMSTSKVVPASSGKMMVMGIFDSLNGTPASKTAIIDANCTHDTSFSTGSGIVGNVASTHKQSDGKFVLVGTMTSYSGTAVSRVIRVSGSGVLDASYPNNATKPTGIKATYMDSSNRLYISSNSGTFNGTAVGYMSRILPDGTVDTTFNTGTGFSNPPLVIKVFDNKIFVGGGFTTFNSTSRRFFIILNEDGSENTTISRPEALYPVSDIYFNSVTGKIEFAYNVPESTG